MPQNISSKLPLRGFIHKLVLDKVISEDAAVIAVQQAAVDKTPLVKYLVVNRIIEAATIARTLASFFGTPLLDLNAFELSLVPSKIISAQLIRRHQVIPLFKRNNKLFIAISDPSDLNALNEIKFHTGLTITSIVVEQDKLEKIIEQILTAEATAVLGDLSETSLEEFEITIDNDNVDVDLTLANSDIDDTPIVRYVNKVLLDAIHKGASDIHFEPFEKTYRVRFRQDGLLYEIATLPGQLGNRITARIKIMSQLDISERRIPQDGRFKIVLSRKRSVDFRVSTCPTVHGEKVVMRILDSTKTAIDLQMLGLEPSQRELFLKAIHKPQGLILVTGPTGSGKTISLYTALNILNTSAVNISTVEDPVEIHLQGISQVNINLKTGLTFATALRAFLRQDPDIIMVGEMRDLETAEIGIKAAQTGHLVLSTLHTNSAPETVTRLLNMGIAAYNIASSISLIMAQRLIRKLCDKCKIPEELPAESLLEQGFSEADIATHLTVYAAKGCDACRDGYLGRTGIYEVFVMNEPIAQTIMAGGNSLEITQAARRTGMLSLHDAGLLKVKQGITSLAELNRVTKD